MVPKTPVSPPMYDASELVPPPATDVTKIVPPPDCETTADDDPEPPQAFGGGPIELSLLPLYPDHVAKHIWDGEVTLAEFIFLNLRLLLYVSDIYLFFYRTVIH